MTNASLKKMLGTKSDMPSSVEHGRGMHLLRALRGTDITVFYQDTDLHYVWIENPPAGWVLSEIIGKDDLGILPEKAAEIATTAKRDVIESGQNASLELEVELRDGSRWFDVWIDPDYDDDGNVQGVLCFSVEITDKKQKEDSLRDLLLEVSHRSRNLLAIVQGIASQSLRTSDNHEALDRFNKRIQSMAITLDLVTKGGWDGAHLHDLVQEQSRPLSNGTPLLCMSGLNPKLSPNAAIHIGLAVQELLSSSVRSGDGHCKLGDVKASASRSNEDGKHGAFRFEWNERTDYDGGEVSSRNMDTLTLRKIVPAALNGVALVSHSNGELTYTLTVPAENFS